MRQLNTTHIGAVGHELYGICSKNMRSEGGSALLQNGVSASSIRNKLRASDTPTDQPTAWAVPHACALT